MKIYLAGTFSNDWRDIVYQELSQHHTLLFPGERDYENALMRFSFRDEELIGECDCILAYFLNSSISIGTSWEIGMALALKKRVILVTEGCDTLHPNLLASAYRVFFNLDKTIEYLKQLEDINDLPNEAKLYYEFLR